MCVYMYPLPTTTASPALHTHTQGKGRGHCLKTLCSWWASPTVRGRWPLEAVLLLLFTSKATTGLDSMVLMNKQPAGSQGPKDSLPH